MVIGVKSDPYAIQSEVRPNNASVIYDQDKYKWNDKSWQSKHKKVNIFESPINIYEVHLGSWKRKDNGDFLTYDELSKELPKYVKDMGYTYVEIMHHGAIKELDIILQQLDMES